MRSYRVGIVEISTHTLKIFWGARAPAPSPVAPGRDRMAEFPYADQTGRKQNDGRRKQKKVQLQSSMPLVKLRDNNRVAHCQSAFKRDILLRTTQSWSGALHSAVVPLCADYLEFFTKYV